MVKKKSQKRTRSSYPTRSNYPARNKSTARGVRSSRSDSSARVAKNTILTVIGLAMLAVILFTLFNLIATPEFLVKHEVESITSDYYENYFYSQILENNSLDPQESDNSKIEPVMSEALKKYAEYGFARVSFRQLLLYDNKKHAGSTSLLSEYCDLDSSIIKIYPESPFGRKNYHVDYSYSCKF